MSARDDAFRDWDAGMKYPQIAEKYGVPLNTIKSWAVRYWKPRKAAEVATEKKKLQPKPRGAPKGNKNALGNSGGAPLGNTNGFKHGLYMGVYMDTLTQEEQDLLDDIPQDEETLLTEQIALLSIRERRLLKTLAEYKGKNHFIESIDSQKSETDAENPDYSQKYTSTTVHRAAAISVVERFEAELTRVQGKKTKAIDSLARLRMEREKLNRENEGDSLADDWIAAMQEVDGDDQQ